MDPVRQIAEAVLYEGYLLWPYRHSAMKNQQRFTLGGVYPEAFARSSGDRSEVALECLLEGASDARVVVELRFLHLLSRRPARVLGDRAEPLDRLAAGGQQHVAWEEASEHAVALGPLRLDELQAPRALEVRLPAREEREPLDRRALILRRWERVEGTLEVAARELGPGLHRLAARLCNTSPWEGEERAAALRHTFLSAHLVVRAEGAALVSATDPPAELREAAEGCRSRGLWPVLVGEEGARHTMLAAPIILEDHPQVAPESPGDHFDGTEIDELLVHSIMALTDYEKREIEATDPRARQILERTSALTPEQLMRLHGAVREMSPVQEHGGELG